MANKRRTPVTYRRAPPRLGEGGGEALAEWLGEDDNGIRALAESGAIVLAETE